MKGDFRGFVETQLGEVQVAAHERLEVVEDREAPLEVLLLELLLQVVEAPAVEAVRNLDPEKM